MFQKGLCNRNAEIVREDEHATVYVTIQERSLLNYLIEHAALELTPWSISKR
jgi:hypothetical protein